MTGGASLDRTSATALTYAGPSPTGQGRAQYSRESRSGRKPARARRSDTSAGRDVSGPQPGTRRLAPMAIRTASDCGTCRPRGRVCAPGGERRHAPDIAGSRGFARPLDLPNGPGRRFTSATAGQRPGPVRQGSRRPALAARCSARPLQLRAPALWGVWNDRVAPSQATIRRAAAMRPVPADPLGKALGRRRRFLGRCRHIQPRSRITRARSRCHSRLPMSYRRSRLLRPRASAISALAVPVSLK